MWKLLLNLIGGPAISGLIEAYKAKLAAGNNEAKIAADLAGKDLELQAKERELNGKQNSLDAGSFWTAAPRAIVCWSLAIYIAKIVVYDTVLHLGTTMPLKGMVAEWMGTIIVAWFGGRTIEKVARIWRLR